MTAGYEKPQGTTCGFFLCPPTSGISVHVSGAVTLSSGLSTWYHEGTLYHAMDTIIHVFRHTESRYNEKNLFTGTIDTELTEAGIRQMEEISDWFRNTPIDIAFTSPLHRTKECLRILLTNHPETDVIEDVRLRERDYGELAGLDKEQYEKEHPELLPIYHRSYDTPPPGGESLHDVEIRVNGFLEDMMDIIRRKRPETVVIAAHGNSIRPIRKRFEHLTTEEMLAVETEKGQILRYVVAIDEA